MPIAASWGGRPALTPGPRLVVPDVVALRLVLAESGRATILVSLDPERGSAMEFVTVFVVAIGNREFVPFCADTECRSLVPAVPDSRPEGEFVGAPAT